MLSPPHREISDKCPLSLRLQQHAVAWIHRKIGFLHILRCSVAELRTTSWRSSQSTWYWVKSPWNTWRRTLTGHAFNSPADLS